MESALSRTRYLQQKTYSSVEQDAIYPEDEPVSALLSGFQTWRHRYLTGWRFAIASNAIACIVVLFVNLIFYIIIATGTGFRDGRGSLYDRSCSRIQGINTTVHLVINILSSILLGASNYTMQILTAPTRIEVDRAHSKSTWPDIGIPSTRNLGHISRKRLICWLCLGLSSAPLHLLWIGNRQFARQCLNTNGLIKL